MPRRNVKLDTKVRFMRDSLRLVGLEDKLRQYDVSERSAYNWYRKVLEALPEILVDEKPGRKSEPEVENTPPF